MNVLTKAPNLVVACVTIVLVAVIVAVTVLSVSHANTQDLFRLISMVFSGAGLLTGTGAFLYSSAAAKSGSTTEQRLNGELDARIQNAILVALAKKGQDSAP